MAAGTVQTATEAMYNATSNMSYMLVQTQSTSSNVQDCIPCSTTFVNKCATEYNGYISVAVCITGTICNIMNTTIVVQKNMMSRLISRVLLALAIVDILLMVEFLPLAYYYYFISQNESDLSYGRTLYMLFHKHVSYVLRAVSICATTMLAIWRYLIIRYPRKSHSYSDRQCVLAICLSSVGCILFYSPTFFIFTIKSVNSTGNSQELIYYMSLTQIGENDTYLFTAFWLNAIIIKLLPCCILAFISYSLVRSLHCSRANKRLLCSNEVLPTILNEMKKQVKAERKANRKNILLLAVLLLFLITELPQGIFGLMVGVEGRCFFLGCHGMCGEIIDIAALTSGCINLILFCFLSKTFRKTLVQLFGVTVFSFRSSSNSDMEMKAVAGTSTPAENICDKQVATTTV